MHLLLFVFSGRHCILEPIFKNQITGDILTAGVSHLLSLTICRNCGFSLHCRRFNVTLEPFSCRQPLLKIIASGRHALFFPFFCVFDSYCFIFISCDFVKQFYPGATLYFSLTSRKTHFLLWLINCVGSRCTVLRITKDVGCSPGTAYVLIFSFVYAWRWLCAGCY